jgi:hypothetical protein
MKAVVALVRTGRLRPTEDCEEDALLDGVFDAPMVGVNVAVFADTEVGVDVAVFVGVSIGVLVAVLVAVAVGVSVGVSVGVLVAVFVTVLVGVLVAVFVAVAVAVLVGVFTAPALMVRVPCPSAWSPPSAARTVNGYTPAGALAEVVSVSVNDGNALPPFEVHVPEFGAKLGVTPDGRPETTLSVPFTVPLPPRTGWTEYVAEPATPAVSVPFWLPTETELILGPSMNIPLIKTPDVMPRAV